MLSEDKISRTAKVISYYLDLAPATVVNELDEIFTEIRTLQQQHKQMKEALERINKVAKNQSVPEFMVIGHILAIVEEALQSLQGSESN